MKRNFKKTFIVIFNVVLFTLLLYYYVNSNIVAMSICLIVIFGIDTMIVCLFLLYLNEIEIDYCHNHLSYLFSTEVIPIKMRDDKLTKYLIQTAKFKAMLSMDDVEKVNIFIQPKNEDTDVFYETIDLTKFRGFYKIK